MNSVCVPKSMVSDSAMSLKDQPFKRKIACLAITRCHNKTNGCDDEKNNYKHVYFKFFIVLKIPPKNIQFLKDCLTSWDTYLPSSELNCKSRKDNFLLTSRC